MNGAFAETSGGLDVPLASMAPGYRLAADAGGPLEVGAGWLPGTADNPGAAGPGDGGGLGSGGLGAVPDAAESGAEGGADGLSPDSSDFWTADDVAVPAVRLPYSGSDTEAVTVEPTTPPISAEQLDSMLLSHSLLSLSGGFLLLGAFVASTLVGRFHR